MLYVKANFLKLCVTVFQARDFNPTAQGSGLIRLYSTYRSVREKTMLSNAGRYTKYLFIYLEKYSKLRYTVP